MANNQLINQVVTYALKNKKSKKDTMLALLNTGQYDISSASNALDNLDKAKMFDYPQEQTPGIDPKQQYQEALKFALDNKNSDDVNAKTRANQFLLDVESKKILPTGYKVQNEEVAAILSNPQTYNDLTPSKKSELLPDLTKAGFSFPRKLNATQQEAQVQAESGISSINDMRSQVFDANGQLKRGNLIKEALPFALGAQELRRMKNDAKDILTRIRTGAALNNTEVSFYSQLVPSATDTAESAKYKLDQLEALYSGISGGEVQLKGKDGKVIKYDDMFDPRQRAEVRTALKSGFEFYHPNQFNQVFGETVVEGDPALETKTESQPGQETTPNSGVNVIGEAKPGDDGTKTPGDTIDKLGKVGKTMGEILGGDQIGEAIGNVIGGQMAKHGKAGQLIQDDLTKYAQMKANGEITEEKYNQLVDILEKGAKEAFGYTGPSFKQIAGDALQAGLTVGTMAVGGPASFAGKVGVGAATGYGFDVASKLQDKDKGIGEAFVPGVGTAVGAALPIAGAGLKVGARAVKNIASYLSGVPKEAIEEAFKRPEGVKNAINSFVKNDDDKMRIVDNAKKGLQQIAKKRGASYASSLKDIEKTTDMTKLSTAGLKKQVIDTLTDFKLLGENGKLDFTRSKFPSAQNSQLKELLQRISKWKDATPTGLNDLKQIIAGYRKGGADTKAFDKIIGTLKENVGSYLDKTNPAIGRMNQAYRKESELIDQISKELSLGEGKSATTALNKLTSIFNRNSEFKERLVKQLGGVNLCVYG